MEDLTTIVLFGIWGNKFVLLLINHSRESTTIGTLLQYGVIAKYSKYAVMYIKRKFLLN